MPGAPKPEKRGESSTGPTTRKAAPNYKVRMDPTNRTLESMITPTDPSQLVEYSQAAQLEERPSKRRGVDDGDAIEVGSDDEDRERLWDVPREEPHVKDIPESVCEFSSIRELRKECKKKANAGESSCRLSSSDLG